MRKIDFNSLRENVKGYFDLAPFLVPQPEAEAVIREGVSFRGTNILILIIAIFIASLGLNVNSTAVIIGAMLISPLMGPIIGIGLGVGIHDFDLIKRSFRNLMMATLFSVATSCLYFLLSPVEEGHSELLARTSPTIYDVFIGFFGGAAGIIAIGSRSKGNVIPGVAIATALMPPLCTVGYGLATLQFHYFIGALYLFFINSVFIACATTLGVKLMKYSIKDYSNPERARRVRHTVYTIALLTMIPAVYLTYTMYVQNTFTNNCTRFVDNEFDFPSTQVLSYKPKMADGERSLVVTLVGQMLPQDSLMLELTAKLHHYRLGGTRLRIIQGYGDNSVDVSQASSAMLRDIYSITQATIARQQATIDSLRRVGSRSAYADSISATIAPELKVIFPTVSDIAVARLMVSNLTTEKIDTVNTAIIQCSATMSRSQLDKLRQYLEARLRTSPVTVIITDDLTRGK